MNDYAPEIGRLVGQRSEEPAEGDELRSPDEGTGQSACDDDLYPFASRGITQTDTRQDEEEVNAGEVQSSLYSPDEPSPPHLWTASFDWYEGSGRVDFSNSDERLMHRLFHLLQTAREEKTDQEYELAGRSISLRQNGIGKGRQARMTYCCDWGDVVFGFADRPSEKRLLANFYFSVSGRPCLTLGATEALEGVKEMIWSLGGELLDLWFQRVDICVDLPGVCFQRDFLPSLEAEHFLTTSEKWHSFRTPGGATGFQVTSNDVKLRFYDKLLSVNREDDDVVREFMKARRWNGEIPPHATRIEFEVHRPWLHRYGLNTVADTVDRIPDMVDKLAGNGPFPFFRLLSGPVDRENKNQGRGTMHPLWASAVERLATISGERQRDLKSNPRGRIRAYRESSRGIGAICKHGALRGEVVSSRQHLHEQLDLMLDLNEITDEQIETRWAKDARRAGTLDSTRQFPPQAN